MFILVAKQTFSLSLNRLVNYNKIFEVIRFLIIQLTKLKLNFVHINTSKKLVIVPLFVIINFKSYLSATITKIK